MATATVQETVSPSLNGSWDDLPADEPVVLDPVPSQPDKVPGTAKAVEPGMCQACGEPVVRKPGSRGRLPKYHDDCRPLKDVTTRASTPSSGRRSKAEAEAEQCIASFQQLVTKGAIMLSVVDRYDAFCVMTALPDISNNLKGVLIRYDSIRKDFLAAQTGGSVIGLVIAVLMLAIPVAAHHGLLGRGKAAQLVMQMPFTLLRIQQSLKEGSEKLTEMMREQLEKAAEENRRRAETRDRANQNGSE